MSFKVLRPVLLISLILVVFLARSCRSTRPVPIATPTVSTPSPAPVIDTPTTEPPTPTPVPMAAIVNSEGITLQEYEEELDRYLATVESVGTNMATKGEQIVIEDLVNQVLLAQAATEAGYMVDQLMVEERLDQLAQEIGGEQVLAAWMVDNGYTHESLARILARALAAAWMRDTIINSVLSSADQVHARQILLNDAETAQEVIDRLSSGRTFEELAFQFDPLMGGDLGWLPRGYLAEPDLEDAIFALQVGEASPVIETGLGYHILYVIEVASQRTISPEARLVMQERALEDWLDERRSQSDIQLLLP
jgi:peptidyl-prolyl cis-trans isomerase C